MRQLGPDEMGGKNMLQIWEVPHYPLGSGTTWHWNIGLRPIPEDLQGTATSKEQAQHMALEAWAYHCAVEAAAQARERYALGEDS